MEIHAPDHPITTWKETARHLAIVTAGVLIALALEGVVSWADHRMLVREAVTNLTSEITRNRADLDGLLAGLAKQRAQLEHADEVARGLLTRKPQLHTELQLDLSAAELKNAAVTTSEITGAFGFMEYELVNRYAAVYDLQAQFMRLQEREQQTFQAVLGFVSQIAGPGEPERSSVVDWRGRISLALAGITFKEQMGRQLLQRYDELLKEK